jgi:ATP-binding cassette, subfamily G (WHITE), member 2, SNQ2
LCISTFFLFVFAMTITMKAWFRALTAAFKQPAPAQTVAGLSILLLTLYTGYTIPQPSMIGALRWITYINVRSFFHIFIFSSRKLML